MISTFLPSQRFLPAFGYAALFLFLAHASLSHAAPDPFLIELKKLIASDGAAHDEFGYSVAVSGDTAVVGAAFHTVGSNAGQGSAYIYGRNAGGGNNWGLVKEIVASDGTPNSGLGDAVAISGDVIVVGSVSTNSSYVFERNAGGVDNWGQVKKLEPAESSGGFARSVAVDGNTIVVGAPNGDPALGIGQAYIFDRNQGGPENWGKVRKLTASDSTRLDFFGQSVGISGDTIVVGAPGADAGTAPDQGEVYLFGRNQGGANNWGEVKKVVASDGAANDQFGYSVAINGDTFVAGAPRRDIGSNPDQGAAYLFDRDQGGAGNWGQTKKIVENDGNSTDLFGYAVAISGDRVVVGRQPGGLQFHFEQAYVFDRNLGSLNNWGELQKLNGPTLGLFGFSVSINGDTAVVGAFVDKIGGNDNQGSAFIFQSVPGPNPLIRAQTVTRIQGDAGTAVIATVGDDTTPPGNLVVSVTSPASGITIGPTKNDNGRVSADVSVSCSVPAGTYLIGLQVTDANGLTATDNLSVIVTANMPPMLGNYPASRVSLDGSINVPASAAPSDDFKGLASVTAAAPGFNGFFTVDKLTGVVILTHAEPPGNYMVTVTATDICGATATSTFALTVLNQFVTITVNSTADTTADDGTCSLREAIIAANTNAPSGTLAGECVAGLPGTDRIAFNIPGRGPQVISPTTALPSITEPVIIDGLTQPGASADKWPPTLKIVLNGSNLGANSLGLFLTSGSEFSTVRGLVVNGFSGFGIFTSENSTIQGNFIGTDVTGTIRLGNGTGIKVSATGNNGNSLIGGGTLATRNLISGNQGDGVVFSPGPGLPNKVQGNFIGTDVSGTFALGNGGNGVTVTVGGAIKNNAAPLIGGASPEFRNIISGNAQDGIFINPQGGVSGSASQFSIEGNFIGTDVTGTAGLGNSGNGISLSNTLFGVLIGGDAASRNVISANGVAGVTMGSRAQGTQLYSNYIGTDVTGTANLGNGRDGVFIGDGSNLNNVGSQIGSLTTIGSAATGTRANLIAFNSRDGVHVEGSTKANSIAYNSIFNNAGLGINLGADGVTPNDLGDADTGPNGLQNFPVLTSAITDGFTLTIHGTFNSKPNAGYTIDFYSNAACSSSGNGEGQVFLGESTITTDGSGNAAINTALPLGVLPGRVITATATNTNYGASPNDPDAFSTSEFSPCQIVEGIGPSPPSQLLNIATRMRVQTGENVLIGGFIITGSEPKKVIIRGIGPSLSSFFSGTLANPTLELFQGNTLLQSNDDWKTDQQTEIAATGIPPTNDLESAIVRTLTPGAYTAILRGSGNTSGIGVVEAYDLNQGANSKLANIATRGFVEMGDNVMIGGFIIGGGGGGGATVVVRAIGPTLGTFGIAGALQDPTLDLVDSNGTVLRSNNDWKETQQTEIEGVHLQPGDDRESVVVQTVAPGNYTAVVRGAGNATGVALVEVYNVR